MTRPGRSRSTCVAPDPEFLYKLTLPFAYPVPPSVPDEEQVTAGVPGTGPYMLEAPMTDEGLTLVRNPHFHVWSPAAQPDGYVDRIEWTFGVEPQAQVEAVAAGDADFALECRRIPGSSKSSSCGSRRRSIPLRIPATFFAVLNTRVAPLRQRRRATGDEPRARPGPGRADLRRRSRGATHVPATPAELPGVRALLSVHDGPRTGGEGRGPARTSRRPKRLVRRSGTAGMRVVFEIAPCHIGSLERTLWGLHGRAARGARIPREREGRPDETSTIAALEFQMAVDAWGADYPAASNFITACSTCDASSIPSSGFCDPRIDAMIDRASQMQLDDPAAAGALWAEIDRAIVDQAPYLWLVNPIRRRVRLRTRGQLPVQPSVGRAAQSALGPVAVVRARELGWSVRVAAAARIDPGFLLALPATRTGRRVEAPALDPPGARGARGAALTRHDARNLSACRADAWVRR